MLALILAPYRVHGHVSVAQPNTPNWLLLPAWNGSYSDDEASSEPQQQPLNIEASRHQVKVLPAASANRNLIELYPSIKGVLAESSSDEALRWRLVDYMNGIIQHPLDDGYFQGETAKLLGEYEPLWPHNFDAGHHEGDKRDLDSSSLARYLKSKWMMKHDPYNKHLAKIATKRLIRDWQRWSIRYLGLYQITRTLAYTRQHERLEYFIKLLHFIVDIISYAKRGSIHAG